jgi:hypothetical protein
MGGLLTARFSPESGKHEYSIWFMPLMRDDRYLYACPAFLTATYEESGACRAILEVAILGTARFAAQEFIVIPPAETARCGGCTLGVYRRSATISDGQDGSLGGGPYCQLIGE